MELNLDSGGYNSGESGRDLGVDRTCVPGPVRRILRGDAVSGKQGAAGAAQRTMRQGPQGEHWYGKKWPAKLTTQPGDDPPVLRSVDASDPPGRLPSVEA